MDMDMDMDIDEYTEIAIHHAAICLQWQASDISEEGHGYPIGNGGDEYTDAVAEIITEAVTSFVSDNWSTLVSANVEAGQCGHDFILTANHHGTGFWDRGLGAAGQTLTDACKGYSFYAEFQLWGDDADGDEHCSDEVAHLEVENTVIVGDLGLSS